MPRRLKSLRPIAVAAAALLALSPLGAPHAQASGYAAEIAKIQIAERQLTLKASMGQQTVRVAPGVAIEALKPGDKVLITFGQDGVEPVITRIEVVKP